MDPSKEEGGWQHLRPVRRFLRVPLYHKIVVANSAFVALAAFAATWLTLRTAGVAGTAFTMGVVAASVLLAVLVTAAANAFLVRIALSTLDPLEDTARRVERGDLDARCARSPLADDQISRLTAVFNEMLEGLEEGRRRQQELSVTVLKAEERERMWLARELYDDTAQVLATALLRLRAAAGTQGPSRDEALQAVRDEIVGALEGIRKIARRLRPPELDELGLSAAITAHARALTEVGGVPIEASVEPVDDLLSREGRLALYRILQEALNNAVHHANATRIDLTISAHSGRIRALVQDDGEGFDPDRVPPSPTGTFGLVGIRERVSYLGGGSSIESAPGKGTTVRIEIPARGSVPDAESLHLAEMA